MIAFLQAISTPSLVSTEEILTTALNSAEYIYIYLSAHCYYVHSSTQVCDLIRIIIKQNYISQKQAEPLWKQWEWKCLIVLLSPPQSSMPISPWKKSKPIRVDRYEYVSWNPLNRIHQSSGQIVNLSSFFDCVFSEAHE